jgi:hypothetical protein
VHDAAEAIFFKLFLTETPGTSFSNPDFKTTAMPVGPTSKDRPLP